MMDLRNFLRNSVAVFALALSACNGSSGEKPAKVEFRDENKVWTPSNTPERQQQRKMTKAEMRETINRFQARCSMEKGECSDSVGMLVTLADDAKEADAVVAGKCTAFLISSKFLLTNGHCVLIGKNPEIKILFPATARFGAEVAAVSRIVKANQDESTSSPLSQDYAVLELAGSESASPLVLAGPEMKADEQYTIVSVNPTDDGGEIVSRVCEVSRHSFIDTESDEVRAFRTANFKQCDVVHGNSGSPVLNVKGEVVSLVFAILDPAKLREKEGPIETWKETLARAGLAFSNRIGCLPSEMLHDAGAAIASPAVCESMRQSFNDDFFVRDTDTRPTSRRETWTVIPGGDGWVWDGDVVERYSLIVPGCVEKVGRTHFNAPVRRVKARLLADGEMEVVEAKAEGKRRVRIETIREQSQYGMELADVTIFDGKAEIPQILPLCREPI